MKVKFSKKTLMDGLTKGGLAALSEDAQIDTTNLSLLIKAVKINVLEDKVTFESSTDKMAIRRTILPEDNNMEIDEEGTVLVDAKEMSEWTKNQVDDSIITMSLELFEKPEPLYVIADEKDSNPIINRIGTVELTATDTHNSSVKWSIDCYDPKLRKMVDFDKGDKGDKCFSVNGKALIEAKKKVMVSVDKESSGQSHNRHCLLVEADNSMVYLFTTKDGIASWYTLDENLCTDLNMTGRFLVPYTLFSDSIGIISEDKSVEIHTNKTINRVFLAQDNLDIRLAILDKDAETTYTKIDMMYNAKVSDITTVQKSYMSSRLNTVSMVNSQKASFTFKKDENKFGIRAVSGESGKRRPITVECHCESNVCDCSVMWRVEILSSVLKNLSGDVVALGYFSNNKHLMITSPNDPQYKAAISAFKS